MCTIQHPKIHQKRISTCMCMQRFCPCLSDLSSMYPNSYKNIREQSLQAIPLPIIQGRARIFACVKGKLLAQVDALPAVVRICGNTAPMFACSTNYLEPLSCDVKLIKWCAKDNVFYGSVEPIAHESTRNTTNRRRLRPM
jgi:hypothetical protein